MDVNVQKFGQLNQRQLLLYDQKVLKNMTNIVLFAKSSSDSLSDLWNCYLYRGI